MSGTVSILNVGQGDTTLSFDPTNPAECIRAGRIVRDMLRRGYALLVKREDGTYQRALDFDEATSCYIIADFDPTETSTEASDHGVPFTAETTGTAETTDTAATETSLHSPAPARKGEKGVRRTAVSADQASVIAVPRSAGG